MSCKKQIIRQLSADTIFYVYKTSSNNGCLIVKIIMNFKVNCQVIMHLCFLNFAHFPLQCQIIVYINYAKLYNPENCSSLMCEVTLPFFPFRGL